MRTTREDVALRAGVSTATVSYVLNDSFPVKESTRERVLSAARELNYIPDMRARSMITNKTMQISVIVNRITDPVSCEMVDYFIQRASEYGYFVNVSTKNHNIRNNIRNIISQRVDGVFILSAPDMLEKDMILDLIDKEIKVVVGVPMELNEDQSQVCCLEVDYSDGMRKAVQYLYEQGHRKIAFLGEAGEEDFGVRHAEAFRAACEKESDIRPTVLSRPEACENKYAGGYNLIKNLTAKKSDFTSIIAADYVTALGAIQALNESDRGVPADTSVIAVGNAAIFQNYHAKLTALEINNKQFAQKAFDMLYNFINGGMVSHEKICYDLIVRGSVGESSGMEQ